jgi:tetratricopeptide (TPR) repeat protein
LAFYDKKDYASGINEFEAALKLDPGNEQLCGIIEATKKAAQAAARAAVFLKEEAVDWAKVIGIDVNDVDQIIADNTKAGRPNPDNAEVKRLLSGVYYIRGLLCLSRNEYDEAIGDFDMAISCEPDYVHAYNKRGGAHQDNGNYDQAIEDFKAVLRHKPNDASAEKRLGAVYSDRGFMYDRNGKYDQTVQDYKMALKLDPDNATYRQLLETAEKDRSRA